MPLRPRFEAAGGDPRRIFFVESITNLREDFEQLGDRVRQTLQFVADLVAA